MLSRPERYLLLTQRTSQRYYICLLTRPERYLFLTNRADQRTHVAKSTAFSARIATLLSRFSIFCWPYRASNKYLASPKGPANDLCKQGSLAGPIGPARYLLLARKGQQKIENLDKKVAILVKNAAEIATCVPCRTGFLTKKLTYFVRKYTTTKSRMPFLYN